MMTRTQPAGAAETAKAADVSGHPEDGSATSRPSGADTTGDGAPATKPLGPDEIAAELSKLGSSETGLSTEQARKRLETDGPNSITAREEPLWHKLVGYFWGPIPWMIEAAAIISLLRQDWADFFVVTGLLVYNALVGFWQDAKAAGALRALRDSLALKAWALRDGKVEAVDAANLVTGDVITVSAGEIIPADLLLLSGAYLSVDQSALTGESLPVNKSVGSPAYSGSIAKQGQMQGVVTATGNHTFLGRTAKLVASAGALSHSQRAVIQIGDFLILLAAFLAMILVGVDVYREIVAADTVTLEAAGEIVQYVLVLLVASIPVALPAVMSVTLALGALALSRQKAIVSRLSSIEELAGVDILCSDKTGTLTQNKLTLSTPIAFGGASQDDVIAGAALATKPDSKDAIDDAVLKGGAGSGCDLKLHAERFRALRPGQQAHRGDADGRIGRGRAICQGRAGGDRRYVRARRRDGRCLCDPGRRDGEAGLPRPRRRQIGRQRRVLDPARPSDASRPAASGCDRDDRAHQGSRPRRQDGDRRRHRHWPGDLRTARPRQASHPGERRLPALARPRSHPDRRGRRGRERRRFRPRLPAAQI